MKVRNLIGAVAVAGIAFAPSAAVAQTSQPAGAAKADDGALKSRIESALKTSDTLKESDIDVDVSNGVVTLTGTVHSAAQSLRAASLAKVTGVTNVENKLTVDSKTTRAMDKAGDKMDKAGDKVADKIDSAGDKTERAMDKAGDKAAKADDRTAVTMHKVDGKPAVTLHKEGEKAPRTSADVKDKDRVIDVDANITDAWITTKVKADFINEDTLKGSDINVDTNNHVVTLKGTVASAAGRARAVAIAKQIKGVNRVVDTLTIAPAR